MSNISGTKYIDGKDLVEAIQCRGLSPLIGLNQLLGEVVYFKNVDNKEKALEGIYIAMDHILSDIDDAINEFL